MIELGLTRISRLIRHTPQPWKAIHVAGTNGKGSICAAIAALLMANGQTCGRFNSPHLIDRWDSIRINEKPVSEALFKDVEEAVATRNAAEDIGASEFELLTATAFEIMNRSKVDFGVIEVGMGGRLDATNALAKKAITVIAKIGLDHQGFLGNTLEEIALQKAGIMRKGVPCVVDDSNPPSVLDVIRQHAENVGAEIVLSSGSSTLRSRLEAEGFPLHQIQNAACAVEAFQLACPDVHMDTDIVTNIIEQVKVPGRLQLLKTRSGLPILLDGAHNVQSAEALAKYVDARLRSSKSGVRWILAASDGKDLNGILKLLLRAEDSVIAVQFGPVDGMPWVKAAAHSDILDAAKACGCHLVKCQDSDLVSEVTHAASQEQPVVIAGSLYLVSDVLRGIRDGKYAGVLVP